MHPAVSVFTDVRGQSVGYAKTGTPIHIFQFRYFRFSIIHLMLVYYRYANAVSPTTLHTPNIYFQSKLCKARLTPHCTILQVKVYMHFTTRNKCLLYSQPEMYKLSNLRGANVKLVLSDIYIYIYIYIYGARGGVVVKALRYTPDGRGFDSRRCHWNFSVT
jgi:hypothetical protein